MLCCDHLKLLHICLSYLFFSSSIALFRYYYFNFNLIWFVQCWLCQYKDSIKKVITWLNQERNVIFLLCDVEHCIFVVLCMKSWNTLQINQICYHNIGVYVNLYTQCSNLWAGCPIWSTGCHKLYWLRWCSKLFLCGFVGINESFRKLIYIFRLLVHHEIDCFS